MTDTGTVPVPLATGRGPRRGFFWYFEAFGLASVAGHAPTHYAVQEMLYSHLADSSLDAMRARAQREAEAEGARVERLGPEIEWIP